jgi:glyoxylase I family protein
MKIEHLALNVPDPVRMAPWYAEHFGWKIRRSEDAPPFARFIADSTGNVMLEIYHNATAPIPDYFAMNPLTFHLALECGPDLDTTRQRLLNAGATDAGGLLLTPSGDRLAMLRDPWGIPIQLCHRKKQI